jgi:hypothetical protein
LHAFSRTRNQIYDLAEHAAPDEFPPRLVRLLRRWIAFDGALLGIKQNGIDTRASASVRPCTMIAGLPRRLPVTRISLKPSATRDDSDQRADFSAAARCRLGGDASNFFQMRRSWRLEPKPARSATRSMSSCDCISSSRASAIRMRCR